MKTITEYQPLIFGKMQKHTELRTIRRTNFLNIVGKVLPAIYIFAGLGLMADTGYMLWNWQFWLVIAPLFVACEGAFWAVSSVAINKANLCNNRKTIDTCSITQLRPVRFARAGLILRVAKAALTFPFTSASLKHWNMLAVFPKRLEPVFPKIKIPA